MFSSQESTDTSWNSNVQAISKDDPLYDTTLQIRFLGTSCYIIQLGDVSLMTDPFFSYHGLFHTALGKISSQPEAVDTALRTIKDHRKPSAIFIGHSHYDHMLDLPALIRKTSWSDIPIIGSSTTKNILAGYGDDIVSQWQEAKSEWTTIAPGVRYKAIVSKHAPQFMGISVFTGNIRSPLTKPPARAKDFKGGPTYTYIFELSHANKTVTIYFNDSASTPPIGFPDKSIKNVDVAILCVPSWKSCKGYPEDLVARLQPHYIIPSHYDNFLVKNGYNKPLYFADLKGFLNIIQQASNYPRFKQCITPAARSLELRPIS